jgi:hypothetical protein
MARFSIQLPDNLAARFDAVAWAAGGRSAMLRRLIAENVGDASAALRPGRGGGSSSAVTFYLSPAELARVDLEAAAMGLRRSAWTVALIRRRLAGHPRFSRDAEVAVLAIQAEVYRIGVNVNQIARSLNDANHEERSAELVLDQLDALRRELRAQLGGLRKAFEGNLAYWHVEG